jgi:RHS repeat-associated protein
MGGRPAPPTAGSAPRTSCLTSTTEPATTDAVTGVRHQRRTTLTYDADGNTTSSTVEDLLGGDAARTTTYDYDDQGRVDRVTDAEGNETSYGYDRFGNVTSMVDANGNRYEYGYTARNMLAEVRLRDWSDDPDGAPDPAPGDALVLHSYAYDFAGRLARDIDAMGRRVEYAYYADDLLTSVTLKGFHDPDGSTRDFVVEADTYDGAGNLTHQVTGNGQTTTDYTINPVGAVDSVVADPGGLARRTAFTYDSVGNVTKVSTSGSYSNVPWIVPTAPEEVSYGYDLAGNRTAETRTNGSQTLTTSYTYDQRGLTTSVTDPRGNVVGADKAAFTTTYVNDEAGRRTTTIGPAVSAESGGNPAQPVDPTQAVGYDTFGDPVAAKDELGNVVRTGYDRLGRATTVTAPAYTPPGGGAAITPVTQTHYDGLGNVTDTVDPRGNVTRYTYDRLNRLVRRDEPAATNDDRAVWRYSYTRTGDLLSVTDPTGARTESTYDDLDRQATLTQVERVPVADNFTTRYGYDDAGNLTSAVSPTGATTLNAYDKVGERTQATDPAGVITKYGYDFAGRQVRVTDGLGRTNRSDFDAFGRLGDESDLEPDNTPIRTLLYGYDPAGNLTSATDPLNHTTTYGYDAANRLVREVEPVTDTDSITTTFGYDAAGNRTRYTDGRGNATIFTVNALGLPESTIEPSTPAHPAPADRTWTTSYDAGGNPVRIAAPGGVTRQRTYDAAGRLIAETGTGAEAATADRVIGYDKAGRLTSAGAPGGDDTFVYNDRGALVSATGPSGTASFGYDGDGNVSTRTDASGTARFGYVNGRPATITDAVTGPTQTLGYDAAGREKTVDYGAGRVRSFGYDDLGRLSSDALANGAGQTVASIGYGYDAADRLTSKTTSGTAGAADNTYTYDQAGRLTSWTAGGATTSYEWDAAGNRTRNGAKTATYDARNRLLSDGDYTYGYTPRGTLASRTSSGLTESFTFDAFDRMTSGAGHTYSYDGRDRVAARDGTTFGYAGLEPDPVTDGTATYARDQAGGLQAVSQGAAKQLALTDRHGDLVGGFNPSDTALSALAGSTAYDPFGTTTATGGTRVGNAGYQSDWTDPVTGQVDMAARWYNPGTGTFTSRDDQTLDPDPSVAANRYTYADADPLDNVDPTGHAPCDGRDLSVLTIGGAGCLPPDNTVGGSFTITNPPHHSGGSSGASGGRSSAASAAAAAAAARAAALARARAATEAARQRAAWAAKHHPLPVPRAALKPVYAGSNGPPVSASPHAPAKTVGLVRDVVADHNKAVQAIYDKAVADAGPVVQDVSTAVRAIPESSPGGLLDEGPAQGTVQGCLLGICAPGQDSPGIPVFPIPNPFAPLQHVLEDAGNAIGGGIKDLWNNWTWPTIVIIGAVIAHAVAGGGDEEPPDKPNEKADQAAKGDAKVSGIVRDAANGKGNFGLGSGSRAESDAAGRAWVGDDATVASDGKTLVSKDGLRQYRPPSYKPNLGKWQANFEERHVPSRRWQSNGHLDIVDP